jgi:hypothetical protein
MFPESEAVRILRENRIPFHQGVDGIPALLCGSEIDIDRLRRLGFRISGQIGRQLVVNFRGRRFGLIV